jgi:hybrid cluster-associated redox disulfide protein
MPAISSLIFAYLPLRSSGLTTGISKEPVMKTGFPGSKRLAGFGVNLPLFVKSIEIQDEGGILYLDAPILAPMFNFCKVVLTCGFDICRKKIGELIPAIFKEPALSSLRQDKEDVFVFCYIANMETSLDSTWTVAQVLEAYPQTAAVFISLKTDCVGCHLDKFCTLEEVAAAYALPLALLLSKLRECIRDSIKRGEEA